MDFAQQIKAAFNCNNLQEMDEAISKIGDYLEYDTDVMDSANNINSLINHLYGRKFAPEIEENILHAIFNASEVHVKVIKMVDLAKLVEILPRLEFPCISYVLSLLAFSKDQKYISIIQQYQNIAELKDDVSEALSEFKNIME